MPSIDMRNAPFTLAVDTSSNQGSVAVAREGEVLVTRSFGAAPSHSQRLLPAIQSAFAEAGIRPQAIGLFAAVTGPGSFTGLRVSLASVRGLAANRPCFGALATDVAAWAARDRSNRILAITDLFHGEVFASVHDRMGRLITRRESGHLAPVLGALRGSFGADLVAVGSATATHREALRAATPDVSFLDLPDGLARHLASFTHAHATDDTVVSSSDLLPFYLRDPLTRGVPAKAAPPGASQAG